MQHIGRGRTRRASWDPPVPRLPLTQCLPRLPRGIANVRHTTCGRKATHEKNELQKNRHCFDCIAHLLSQPAHNVPNDVPRIPPDGFCNAVTRLMFEVSTLSTTALPLQTRGDCRAHCPIMASNGPVIPTTPFLENQVTRNFPSSKVNRTAGTWSCACQEWDLWINVDAVLRLVTATLAPSKAWRPA